MLSIRKLMRVVKDVDLEAMPSSMMMMMMMIMHDPGRGTNWAPVKCGMRFAECGKSRNL